MKKNEITPKDSACPVFLDPISEDQILADEADRVKRENDRALKAEIKQSVLDRLGITAEEAAALLR